MGSPTGITVADPLPSSRSETRAALLSLLAAPRLRADAAAELQRLLASLESSQPADLQRDRSLLAGVWQLRWSSSSLPYLAVAPWLENLQLLDPERGRGLNLLRPAGPLAPLAAIAVQADLTLVPAVGGEPAQRVAVRFRRGGWLGPRLADRRLQLLRELRQSFPAWLDITVLDAELRICRGQAGTLFVLTRRPDLHLRDWLP
ncbi:MAG: PAP/fibrillin family protein [Synechococcus sp.]|nr:PAP/fibrillin family protein [Synechococcus sp.]